MSKPTFKIVLLGEGRVGKTSLVLRFVNNIFSDTQQSTVQATYLQKDVKVDEKSVSLSVWDTAGQEKFHALGPIYYRNANGALLVYDITDQDTFVRVKNWIKELRRVVGNDIAITIAGNKCDLVKQRQVDEKTAEEYAAKVGATHILTSAKANKGVDEAFMDLTRRILESKSKQPLTTKSSQATISLDEGVRPAIHGGGSGGLRVVQDSPTTKPTQPGCCGAQ